MGRRSGATHAPNLADRLLIVHGLAAQRPRAAHGLPPPQAHSFRDESRRHFYERMTAFFERELLEGP
jgi:dipeptidyl aminopeptidase/acylaminoacyl peptidase